jgi:hypothetical protein
MDSMAKDPALKSRHSMAAFPSKVCSKRPWARPIKAGAWVTLGKCPTRILFFSGAA